MTIQGRHAARPFKSTGLLPAKQVILFGIDFGTTYSGVAWACTRDIEQIQTIKSWDSELYTNSENEKVLSALHFGKGNGEEVTWGYSVPTKVDPIQWFKLLLIDEDDLPEDVRASSQLCEARGKLREVNKTAVEVIGTYLRKLWGHAIQTVTDEVGKSIINYSEFHVVITLPAIWPEYARVRMQDAAKFAGILESRDAGETRHSFLSEPEAAAVATMVDLTGKNNINRGDTFVVVDCGGGTVDLISYEVAGTSPMTVRECAPGKGALCGAIFVDDAFTTLLKEKLHSYGLVSISNDRFKKLINDEWEHGIKVQFTGAVRNWKFDLPFECLPPDARRLPLTPPTIEFEHKDIRGVFDPVIEQILRLVDEQIAYTVAKKGSRPKYIVLVGGFGRCRYLLESLKSRVDVEVLQSRGGLPWSAICRGALINAMTTQNPSLRRSVFVESRIARCSYGIYANTPWVDGRFNEADKYFCERRQRWMARNQTKWFLREGETVDNNKVIRRACSRFIDESSRFMHVPLVESFIISHSLPPPKRKCDSVDTLCTVKWETAVDFTKVARKFTDCLGHVYYEMEFEIEMTCIGGSLDIAIYHGGVRQASKNVSVEFQDHFRR